MFKLLNWVLALVVLSTVSYARDNAEPKTYSGKNTFKTDHFVFLYLNQTGNNVTLSYLDTGPLGKKILPSPTPKTLSKRKNAKIHKINKKTQMRRSTSSSDYQEHWNTNDGNKSHVLTEVTLPAGYVAETESVSGKSYGEGCESMTFSGIDKSVALCSSGHVQTVTLEWKFTAYPTDK